MEAASSLVLRNVTVTDTPSMSTRRTIHPTIPKTRPG